MVDAFDKISASPARQRRESAWRFVHSEQDLLKLSSLFHYEIAAERGRCSSARYAPPEGQALAFASVEPRRADSAPLFPNLVIFIGSHGYAGKYR